jgi:hypothetical protein
LAVTGVDCLVWRILEAVALLFGSKNLDILGPAPTAAPLTIASLAGEPRQRLE